MENKFFEELSRRMREGGIESSNVEDKRLEVFLHGRPVLFVSPGHDAFLLPSGSQNQKASELYHRVAGMADEVYEYVEAVQNAPLLRASITLMLMTPYYPVNRKVDLPEAFDALFYPPDMETVPKRLAIVRANRYMVERSDFLIAYVRHPASNARELLEYAGTGKRKGKIHITNLAEGQIPLPKKTDDVI